MIRFALDANRNVVPDLCACMPGRGMWVVADRDAIVAASKGSKFKHSIKTKVKVDPMLPDTVKALLLKRCLELVGFAKTAGVVVVGQSSVEQALKNGELAYIIMGSNAEGLEPEVPQNISSYVIGCLPEAELGAVLSSNQIFCLGFKPHSLTSKLRLEFTRWQGVNSGAINPSLTDCEKP